MMIHVTILILFTLSIARGAATTVSNSNECKACVTGGNNLCVFPTIFTRLKTTKCCPPGDLDPSCLFCRTGSFESNVQTCPSASFCGKTEIEMEEGKDYALGHMSTSDTDFCVYTLDPKIYTSLKNGKIILTSGDLKVDVKVHRRPKTGRAVPVTFNPNSTNTYDFDEDKDKFLVVTIFRKAAGAALVSTSDY